MKIVEKKKKGRILKIRLGYNANSSSISAFVTVFLWTSTAVITLVNTICAVALSKDNHKDKDTKNEQGSET